MPEFYDVYLYILHTPDNLNKIGHVSLEDAQIIAKRWCKNGYLYDYMIVKEGDAPLDTIPNIKVRTPEWVSLYRP